MNQLAVDFIKTHEGCRLQAYQDSGGVWTIGYGATGSLIGKGTVWTQERADSDLSERLGPIEELVKKNARSNLSIQQEAALISFVYNAGESAFAGSTLLKLVQAQSFLQATRAFLSWDHVKGAEIKGLLRRRLDEAILFLEGS